jgi:hypothetical protein
MPHDFTVAKLQSSLTSNTSQAWIGVWDSYLVPAAGVVRNVYATATSLTSNARVNTVDVFRQPSGTAAASNSATSILVAPISLGSNAVSTQGFPSQLGQRLNAGDVLQLKADSGTTGGQNAFGTLTVSVSIEYD